ncbi:MAG: hypothetical protein ACKVQU_18670 [Burkholderiales bacterium]
MIEKAIQLLASRNWQAAHKIVQDDESPLGYWAHGIVHLQEGDLDHARYWYRKAKRAFPGAEAIEAEIEAIERAVKKT